MNTDGISYDRPGGDVGPDTAEHGPLGHALDRDDPDEPPPAAAVVH